MSIIFLLCAVPFPSCGMKRNVTDEFDVTAIFKDSARVSQGETPAGTPRVTPRLDVTTITEVPRSVTSFLYAFMHTYQVNTEQYMIEFSDYLEAEKKYSLPLNIVSEWIVALQKEAHESEHHELVDACEKNADQRDLQCARKRLYEFIKGNDLLPPEIILPRYTQFLIVSRRARLKAFTNQDIPCIVACQHRSLP